MRKLLAFAIAGTLVIGNFGAAFGAEVIVSTNLSNDTFVSFDNATFDTTGVDQIVADITTVPTSSPTSSETTESTVAATVAATPSETQQPKVVTGAVITNNYYYVIQQPTTATETAATATESTTTTTLDSNAVTISTADTTVETATTTTTKLCRPTIKVYTSYKGFVVGIKKVSKATGYQIKYIQGSVQYSLKTTALTKKVITPYKGKTSVYVRAYRTAGGKTTYSKWSQVGKVTVK